DRTGDEIHTSREIGPISRTVDMRGRGWVQSYEKNNVAIGLAAGVQYEAQIGKGMWAKPDNTLELTEEKIGHVEAGENTAWVPSPTAATLHALHYHEVDVRDVQDRLLKSPTNKNYRDDILQVPLEKNPTWSKKEIREEVENNAQKMLGYVVRWVE